MRGSPEQPWFTLRLRALAALAVIAVALPAAAGLFALSRTERDLAASVKEGELAAARSLAAQLEIGTGFGMDLMRAAANSPALQAFVRQGNTAGLTDTLKNLVLTVRLYNGVWAYDQDGRLLAQYPPDATDTAPKGAGPKVYPAVARGSDAVVPIAEPMSAVSGTLTGELSFRHTVPEIASMRFGRTGSATITDREGNVLVTGEPSRRGGRIASPPMLDLIRRGAQGTTEFYATNTRRGEIGAVVPVAGHDWSVLVTQAQSEAFAPVRALRNWLLALVVALVAIGGIAVLLVSQSIGRYERRLRERLDEQQRLNRALDAYSGRVAHDLRSPLGAISMAVELMQPDYDKLGERSRTAMGIARNQAQRAMHLVADLLDLAKASGTPRPEPIDLASLLADAAGEVEDVDMHLEQVPPSIVADRRALRQALTNLLANAGKYAGTNGHADVTVHCHDAGDGWRISVADRGPGLALADAPTVFEPFRRGQGAKSAGSGLGLTIVAAMAEAHGGKAGYEPREGGGSVFWIYLPKMDPEKPDPKGPAPVSPGPSSS